MKPNHDEDASERLMRLLAPLHECAVSTARRLSRCRADGDDLFQEAVLRALDRLPALRDEASFRAWFFAILFSRHRQRHRRDFWRRFLPLGPAEELVAPRTFDDDGADRMACALALLSPREREALVLADVSDFRLDEIAALQNSTLSAVKSRVARARARVRARYLQDEPQLAPLASKKEPL